MRSHFVFLAALALLSGCVIHSGDDETKPRSVAVAGDISFFWSFAGKTCDQSPEIRWVHVSLQGPRGVEDLENNGYYRCNWGGWDGVKLEAFPPGAYNYTIDGVDSSDHTIYTANGSLNVNGPIEVRVDLARIYTQGSLEVLWSFGPERKSCAAAGITGNGGITKVEIKLNNSSPVDIDCNFQGGQSAVFDLDPATYQVEIEGYTEETDPASGSTVRRIWYRGEASITVAAGGNYQLPVSLEAVAAGATFAPVMPDRVSSFDCASTGVTALHIQLYDEAGNCYPPDPLAPGGCGFTGECTAFAAGGFYFPYVPAGDYRDETAGTWTSTWQAVIRGWGVGSTNVTWEGASGYVPIAAGLSNQRKIVPMNRR